jgi:dolichyl-phosphate-mannose-protein mannosyltransferase
MVLKYRFRKVKSLKSCEKILFADTAILTQSRFILMESIMMSFGLAALLSVLKFRKVSARPFSPAWFTWLILSSLLLTCAFW